MKKTGEAKPSAIDVRRGDPSRASSTSVIRMGPALATHKGEGQGVLHPRTEAEQQLQELLHKQLDVTKEGFERREKKEFTAGVIFEPLATKGTHSLSQYSRLQDTQMHLEELRHLGLTNEEIGLMLGEEEAQSHLDTGVALRLGKRAKVETDGGLGADPMAQRQRLAAIEHKLKEKQEEDERSLSTESRGVALVSRHAMEVEVSVRHAGSVESSRGNEDLSHLVLQKERNNWNFPKEIMPSHTPYKVELMLKDQGEHQSELQRSPSPRTGAEEDEGAHSPGSPPQLASIEPLPVQVIERNRLSLEEIRKLPRFEDYTPGLPSKVLFVKNLHHKVTEKDLIAIFGQFQGNGEDPVLIRLMKGKMKGQAFIEFHTEDQAEAAMKLVNGYMMRGRPVIIQFGKRKS